MGSGKTTVGRRVAADAAPGLLRQRRDDRGPRRPDGPRDLAGPTASRPIERWRRRCSRRRWPARTRRSIAAAGGVVLREDEPPPAGGPNVFTVRLRRRPGRSARRESVSTSTARCSTTTLRPRCALGHGARGAVRGGGGRHRRSGRPSRRGRHGGGARTGGGPGGGAVIRVPVPLEAQPYEVWVGAGAASLLDERPARGRPSGWPWSPSPASRTSLELDRPAVIRHEIGDGEQHKTLATVEELCRDFARAGLTRHRLRGRSGRRDGDRRGRVRRRQLPPRPRGGPRSDDPARHGRRRHRRQDRREPARGQEPGRRLLATRRRPLRPRRARHAAGAGAAQRAGRDGEVPLPDRRRPGAPAVRGAGGPLRRHQVRSGGAGRA